MNQIPLLLDNENQRKYLVETEQEYGVWLSRFERMITQ